MAGPAAHAAPAPPKTASGVASPGRPLAVGLGRQPHRWDVSAEARCRWMAPAGGAPAPGRGPGPRPDAGPGSPGPRGSRPLGAPGRTDPGAVAGRLAARPPP